MNKSSLFVIIGLPVLLFGQTHSAIISDHIAKSKNLLDQKKHEEALTEIKITFQQDSNLTKEDSITLYNLMVQCHSKLKQYENAAKDYEQALTNTSGYDTLQALLHYQLGIARYRLSEYSVATTHIINARDLYRKLFGTDDINYTASLNTLGFLYNVQAKYSEAEKVFQEAKQINLRLTGGEDLQYSRIITNLADVYCKLNRYDQADELYKTSLRIKEKLSGKKSREYATTLYGVANFQASLGKYENAISTIKEGIAIYNALNEIKHPDYLKFLDNLALLTEKSGDKTEAERLIKEAINRRDTAGLDKQDDYALNLGNLGRLYLEEGKADLALPLVEKATPLIATIYGKNHPAYAGVLTTLANIQAERGDHENANANYEEAIRIIQRVLGKEHIESFNIQFAYAKFLRKTGKKTEAIALFKKIDRIPRMYLKRATRFLSEMELSEKVNEYKSFIHEIYSFLLEMPDDPELSSLAYNASLYYRGFILNNLQRIRLSMNKALKVSDARDEVISLHRQLENELNRPISERANTADLEKKISQMESDITHTLGSLAEEAKELNWEDIQLALADDEASVEYISFPNSRASDSIYYGALILTRIMEAPIFIPLCKESDFATILASNALRTPEYVNSIYNFSSRGAATIEDTKVFLTDLIWQPLQNKLHGIKRLFLVPDGLLSRVNLAALPTSLETVVADSIELILVSSTRQVVPSDENIMAYSAKKTIVVGGIDYDHKTPEVVSTDTLSAITQRSFNKVWGALPWAEKESNEVAKLLMNQGYYVNYMKSTDAREKMVVDSLENLHGYRIIHFATHGYFKSGTKSDEQESSGFYGKGMLNSGLVLTGANVLQTDSSNVTNEDGLLSAYEISHLDLSQTELVVLSACETAIGDLNDLEGVYGLQRAFKLSGAGQLIMSLWQVPDRETKDFMLSFYRNWLTDKSTIRKAFQKTQTEFRQRFVNPYQWAGFVLLE